MPKNKKHLEFYKMCIQDEISMPSNGLCNCAIRGLISEKLLELFTPNKEEEKRLDEKSLSTAYWGYEVPFHSIRSSQYSRYFKFTTLRQTIVLLMAAMNEEL